MFSVISSYCCEPFAKTLATQQSIAKIASTVDIIVGLVTGVIGVLAITGVIPRMTHVASMAVVITAGVVNFMLGSYYAFKTLKAEQESQGS